ncbi:MAG: alpha-1,2-fucosyltransferase [Prevotella sp.]|nr:alpha-1,2-fucosyltransferase [Prevotella sp.]
MIFVHDKGRLCNNILQYGHLYAWGREHGRKTMSMRFAYKYQYFHICHTRHHNFLTYVFAKYASRMGLIPTVHFDEENGDYSREEQTMLESKLVVAAGWYARWYDLFIKYKQEILRLFAFHDEIEQHVARLLPTDDCLRLGVHIRRGDYATFYDGRFYYTDEQYVAVVRGFLRLHPGKQVAVFICGNDPQLDREYFRRELPQCRIEFPDGNPAEDLCLLSHCHYLIGAPSTFTLVAAMYHDAPLYWIEKAEAPLSEASFKAFDDLFRHIY